MGRENHREIMRDIADKTIRLAGIIEESIVDGTGIRLVVFCQGCRHNCRNCFSPQTHSFTGGQEYAMEHIIGLISENPLLQGITFSGGDPWEQADKCSYIAGRVKQMGLDVWCYTGYVFEDILAELENRKGWQAFIKNIDVLVDGKYEDANRSLLLPFRGSGNQRLVDVRQSLIAGRTVLFDPAKGR